MVDYHLFYYFYQKKGMKNCLLIILIIIFIVNNPIYSQEQAQKDLEKIAQKHYNNLNYKLAAETYEKLINLDPNNQRFAYYFAISNFLAGYHVDKSLKYIEPLLGKNTEFNDIPYWIGKMYMYNYQFNDAIDMFNTYIAGSGISQENIKDAQKHIQMCLNALEYLNKPKNITFENLGPNINSSANEFLPLISENEDFIIFTSDKRYDEDAKTFDENIYISYAEKTGWSLAKPLSYLNTFDPEKAVGLSPDGKTLYVCGHFANSYSDINVAIKKNNTYKFDNLNNVFSLLGNKLTTGASITEDGNTIFFSATRNDGYGKNDIYVIRLLPNGQWSKPQNLGEVINTPADEIYPLISPDGKTLYFASNGNKSMGDYDIFVSYYNEITGEWTQPQNLGYPINSPGPDYNISFTKNKKYAYIASIRKEGLGGLDLYRISFNDIDAPVTVIKGYIYSKTGNDSTLWKPNQSLLDITIYDEKNNVFGKYTYNFSLNRFVAALPAGRKYKLIINAPGYKSYEEVIDVLDRSLFIPEKETFYVLTKNN